MQGDDSAVAVPPSEAQGPPTNSIGDAESPLKQEVAQQQPEMAASPSPAQAAVLPATVAVTTANGGAPAAPAAGGGGKAADGAKGEKPKLPRPEGKQPCPRCNSEDTKFCYYNNYNIKQPRYFCRVCQRYWTAGGALRDVPPGAGRRKSKSASAGPGDKTTSTAISKPDQSAAHRPAASEALAMVANLPGAGALPIPLPAGLPGGLPGMLQQLPHFMDPLTAYNMANMSFQPTLPIIDPAAAAAAAAAAGQLGKPADSLVRAAANALLADPAMLQLAAAPGGAGKPAAMPLPAAGIAGACGGDAGEVTSDGEGEQRAKRAKMDDSGAATAMAAMAAAAAVAAANGGDFQQQQLLLQQAARQQQQQQAQQAAQRVPLGLAGGGLGSTGAGSAPPGSVPPASGAPPGTQLPLSAPMPATDGLGLGTAGPLSAEWLSLSMATNPQHAAQMQAAHLQHAAQMQAQGLGHNPYSNVWPYPGNAFGNSAAWARFPASGPMQPPAPHQQAFHPGMAVDAASMLAAAAAGGALPPTSAPPASAADLQSQQPGAGLPQQPPATWPGLSVAGGALGALTPWHNLPGAMSLPVTGGMPGAPGWGNMMPPPAGHMHPAWHGMQLAQGGPGAAAAAGLMGPPPQALQLPGVGGALTGMQQSLVGSALAGVGGSLLGSLGGMVPSGGNQQPLPIPGGSGGGPPATTA